MQASLQRFITTAFLCVFSINACSHYNTTIPNNKLAKTLTNQTNSSTAVTWLNNSHIALSTTSSINVIPAQQTTTSHKTITLPQASTPAQLTSSGEYLTWVEGNNLIQIWNTTAQEDTRKEFHSQAKITGLALDSSSRRLVYSTYDNTVTIINIDNSQVQKNWLIDNWITNLSYTSDGELIFGADLTGLSGYLFDSATGETIRRFNWFESSSPVLYAAKISPQGNQIAWASRSIVQVMKLVDETIIATFVHEDYVNAIAWTPDGNSLATAASALQDDAFNPCVYIFDIQTGKIIHQISLSAPVIDIAFSPDGNSLATITSEGLLEVWVVNK